MATTSNPGSVLVIGAGIAGLAAARELARDGREVIVLEARDRVGGRLWTDRSRPGMPLDLGASWIHGVDGNPLTALRDEFALPTAVLNTDIITAHIGGRPLSPAELAEYEADAEAVLGALLALASRQPHTTYAAAVDQALAQLGLPAARTQRLRDSVLHFVQDSFGADADQVPLWTAQHQDGYDGDEVVFTRGYDEMATRLAEGLDVRLSHVVQRISHDAAGVLVRTDNGDFSADQVVVTVPLGVLKSGAIAFDPPLPEAKLGAIARLGMGVYNKLYLCFTERFWDDVGLIAQFGLWQDPMAAWFPLHSVAGVPVIVALRGGSVARRIETLDDDATVAEGMSALRAIYGENVPDPIAHRITRWGADPFALGSYSYPGIDATPEDRAALAEPIAGRVFFAGEATHATQASTVHGALLSGRVAAERITDLS